LYKQIIKEVETTLDKKGMQYGDTFQRVPDMLRILYSHKKDPKTDKYILSGDDLEGVLVVARILDKLLRVATGNQGEESAYKDIMGYCALEEERIQLKQGGRSGNKTDK
jgi:hypothetical protein